MTAISLRRSEMSVDSGDLQKYQYPQHYAPYRVKQEGTPVLEMLKQLGRSKRDKPVEEPVNTCDTAHANITNVQRHAFGRIDERDRSLSGGIKDAE